MTTHTKVVHDGRIAKACDCESTRYALGAVHVTPADDGEVLLTATDGRILAITKAEGSVDGFDPSDPPLIPANIFPKNAKERNSLHWRPATETTTPNGETVSVGDRSKAIELNGSGRWETPFHRTADITEGRFPRYLDVIPIADDVVLEVTLDPQLLLNLAKAICDDRPAVTLLLSPGKGKDRAGVKRPEWVNGPVCVKGDAGIGVMMPSAGGESTAADFRAYRREVADAFKAACNPPADDSLGEIVLSDEAGDPTEEMSDNDIVDVAVSASHGFSAA